MKENSLREKKEKLNRKGFQVCWNCGSELANCKIGKTTISGQKVWLCPSCWSDESLDDIIVVDKV
jgi:hypothetical protein